MELESLNEYRFYKLEPKFPDRCSNIVENIYYKVHPNSEHPTRICGGHLKLRMIESSIIMRCPNPGCFTEVEIPRVCNACGRETLFDDITCDTCEPVVINITTWNVSIEECHKAIKKINRAFKQNLIPEDEWKTAIKIQTEEIGKCEKSLAKLDLI